LEDIPPNIRVHIDMVALLRATEKECAETANYAKGHGDELHYYLGVYHPDFSWYSLARACGGARQDLAQEGAGPLLMNIPVIVPWLHNRLCITPDNLIQKSLFITLRSMEIVASLRVHTIMHIAICLPMRWLTGNSEKLAEFDFSALDMNKALSLLESAMEEVAEDGELFLDEFFMMNIFSELTDVIDPLYDYLAYMFEEKMSIPAGGSRKEEDKFHPFNELRAEVFYPTRSDVRQSHDYAVILSEKIAQTFIVEIRDISKATSEYSDSTDGRYSRGNVCEY
jgi:hypothetical protein